jgi:VWFA-related protein
VRFLEGAILLVSALLIAGCSSAVNTSSPAQPIAAPGTVPTQAWLDLCPIPDPAPPDLRSKAGYTQWAVSVTDTSGAPLTGLEESDFAARSGSNSYPISWFRETANPETPISLVLLVDVSVSMWNKTVVTSGGLAQVRATLEHAVAEMNDCDEIGTVIAGGKYHSGFDPAQFGLPTSLAEATLIQPFTTDHVEAILKIYSLVPAGPSKLADGLRMALSQLGQAHYPNRALVVLTDGLDPEGIDDAVAVLEQAHASGIPLWVIGIGDPDAKTGALSSLAGTYRVDARAVERLAAAGGGRSLFAVPLDKDAGVSLAVAIGIIVKGLGQGYAIGVIASPGGTPAIALAKPSNATVRAAAVPSQVLADAAARPPPTQVHCAAEDWPPAAVSSNAGFTLVRVLVTGPDKRAVSGLKSAAFVASTGTDVYPLVYFHENQGDSPKAIVISIDTSGSMDLKLQTIRSEVGKFLGQLNPCDQVALVAFSDRTFLLEDLTTNHKTVEHRLALLHAYGRTAIYDAVNQSMETLSKAQYHDRTLVLVTDGMDNASQTSKDALLATVAHNQVPIYAIGIGDPNLTPQPSTQPFLTIGETEEAVDAPTLDAIASATGGKDFIVPPMDQDRGVGFTAALHDVADQLDNGYEVGFIEGIPGSTPVISVPSHPDYVVKIISVPVPAN